MHILLLFTDFCESAKLWPNSSRGLIWVKHFSPCLSVQAQSNDSKFTVRLNSLIFLFGE